MISLSTTVFSLVISSLPTAQSSHLELKLCDIGERQQFEIVPCEVELKNNGDKPIRISEVQALAPADHVQPRQLVVAPHSVAYLKTILELRDAIGFTHHKFTFATDEPGLAAQRSALVQGFVNTVLEQATPTMDFESVNLESGSPSKSLTLTSRDVKDFRVLAIVDKPDYLDARIEKDGKTVTATLGKNAPWGLLQDAIKLRINAPQQKEAWIRLKGNVSGEIVADSNPFPLGTMRTGDKNEFLIRLTSRTGKDFKIGRLELTRTKGSTMVMPCTPAKEGCQLVRLVVSDDQPRGVVGGQLIVGLPDFNRTLPIRLVGMLLNPQTPIHDLNKEMEKKREVMGSAQSTVTEKSNSQNLDVGQALKQAVEQQGGEAAPPPGNGPLLRWTVANDQTVYGYAIYRADTDGGPSQRVNKETIRVLPHEGQTTTHYQWRDNTAESGKTYWYSIGVVKIDGQKDLLGNPQKVVAK